MTDDDDNDDDDDDDDDDLAFLIQPSTNVKENGLKDTDEECTDENRISVRTKKKKRRLIKVSERSSVKDSIATAAIAQKKDFQKDNRVNTVTTTTTTTVTTTMPNHTSLSTKSTNPTTSNKQPKKRKNTERSNINKKSSKKKRTRNIVPHNFQECKNVRQGDDFWYPYIEHFFDNNCAIDYSKIQETITEKRSMYISIENIRNQFRTNRDKYLNNKLVVNGSKVIAREEHKLLNAQLKRKNSGKGKKKSTKHNQRATIQRPNKSNNCSTKRSGTKENQIYLEYVRFIKERKCYVNVPTFITAVYLKQYPDKSETSCTQALYSYLQNKDKQEIFKKFLTNLNLEKEKFPNASFYVDVSREIEKRILLTGDESIHEDICWQIITSAAMDNNSIKGTQKVKVEPDQKTAIFDNLKRVMKDDYYGCIRFKDNDGTQIIHSI